jgi:hypothetical protein
MRPISCPEMSATKYQAMLLNIPEEQRPHLPTVLATTQSLPQPLLHKTQSVPLNCSGQHSVDCTPYFRQ